MFDECPLPGAVVVRPERATDERGWFARTFCVDEFERAGLNCAVSQCSTSFNARRGTLRGMHYQNEDQAEVKLVRCTRGAIYDVIVDLRPSSPTYLSWFGAELTAANGVALYVPELVAHGFLTLEDDSEVFYQISTPYEPGAARGVRWDDPAFAIEWPSRPAVVSDRDRVLPNFCP